MKKILFTRIFQSILISISMVTILLIYGCPQPTPAPVLSFDITANAFKLIGDTHLGNKVVGSAPAFTAPTSGTDNKDGTFSYTYTMASTAFTSGKTFQLLQNGTVYLGPKTSTTTVTGTAVTGVDVTAAGSGTGNVKTKDADSWQFSSADFTAASVTLTVKFTTATGLLTYTLTIVAPTSFAFSPSTTAFKLIGDTHLGNKVVGSAPAFTAPTSGTDNKDGTFSYTYTMASTAFISVKTFQLLQNGTVYLGPKTSTTTVTGTAVTGVDVTAAGSGTGNVKTKDADSWQFSTADFTAASVTLTVKFNTATGLSTYTLTIANAGSVPAVYNLANIGIRLVGTGANMGNWIAASSTLTLVAPTTVTSTNGNISTYQYTLNSVALSIGNQFNVVVNSNLSGNATWGTGVTFLNLQDLTLAGTNATSFDGATTTTTGAIRSKATFSTSPNCTLNVAFNTTTGVVSSYTLTISGGTAVSSYTFDPSVNAFKLIGDTHLGNWVVGSAPAFTAPASGTNNNDGTYSYVYTMASTAFTSGKTFQLLKNGIEYNGATSSTTVFDGSAVTGGGVDVSAGGTDATKNVRSLGTNTWQFSSASFTATSVTLTVKFTTATGLSTYTLTVVAPTSFTFDPSANAFKLIGTTHLGDYVVANAPAFTAPASGTNNGDGTFSYTYTMGSTAFIQWKTFQILKNGTQYFGQTSSTTTFAGTSVTGGGVDATTAGSDATKNIKTYGNDNWQFSTAGFTASSVTLIVKFTTATGASAYTLTINN